MSDFKKSATRSKLKKLVASKNNLSFITWINGEPLLFFLLDHLWNSIHNNDGVKPSSLLWLVL